MSESVLDASALMAVVRHEPGEQAVTHALYAGAAIASVNLAEVATRLSDLGMSAMQIRTMLDSYRLDVIPFDAELAYRTGMLRRATRQLGLSLGDRACLATAQLLGLPVLTADRAWAALAVGVAVQVIR